MWRIWPAKKSNSVKKSKKGLLHRSRLFKVIEVGTNRKPIRDFLLVINSNWQVTTYLVQFLSDSSLLFKFWTLCVFEPPFGGLRTIYDVHLGLIGKRIVDFLLVIIKLFSPDVMAEALWAKIDRKSAISLQQVWSKISGWRDVPTNNFCMDS